MIRILSSPILNHNNLIIFEIDEPKILIPSKIIEEFEETNGKVEVSSLYLMKVHINNRW